MAKENKNRENERRVKERGITFENRIFEIGMRIESVIFGPLFFPF